MNAQQKRLYLASLYGGSKTWVQKVSKMSDEQVTAVYLRISRKENRES